MLPGSVQSKQLHCCISYQPHPPAAGGQQPCSHPYQTAAPHPPPPPTVLWVVFNEEGWEMRLLFLIFCFQALDPQVSLASVLALSGPVPSSSYGKPRGRFTEITPPGAPGLPGFRVDLRVIVCICKCLSKANWMSWLISRLDCWEDGFSASACG